MCFSVKILGRDLDYYHVLHYCSHILDAASWFPPKGCHTIISTLRQHGAQCLNQQLISGRDKKESSKEKKNKYGNKKETQDTKRKEETRQWGWGRAERREEGDRENLTRSPCCQPVCN